VTNNKQFLDPNIIVKLGKVNLVARLVVEGFISGLHKSPFRGFNVEFAEHRPYMPGDEIRHIDWKVFGKSDKFYIKQFEEETNLKAYIFLDKSASMNFPNTEDALSKLTYGSYLSASLAYLMLQQRDSVGLATFSRKIHDFIPPRSQAGHLHQLHEALTELKGEGDTDLAGILNQLAERIKRRALIILISDLFASSDKEVVSALKHLRHQKHEIIVFHLLSRQELQLDFTAASQFIDLESGERMVASPREIQKQYQEKIAVWLDYYRQSLQEASIDYQPLNTTLPLEYPLISYLSKRMRKR